MVAETTKAIRIEGIEIKKVDLFTNEYINDERIPKIIPKVPPVKVRIIDSIKN